jgi:hypothetical protein
MVSHKIIYLPAVPAKSNMVETWAGRCVRDYVKSGWISDRLSKQFAEQRRPLQVERTGHITARLSWNPPEQSLALILGRPFTANDRV